MVELTSAARRVLARQDGLATRAQLLASGLSKDAVGWNAGRAWRVVLPRVFLVSEGEVTQRRRLIAGLLWAGPESVLAGPTAARFHGIQGADPRSQVHLLVPGTRSSRAFAFAAARRSLLVDSDVRTIGPLRVSSPARAAADAALASRASSTRTAILVEAVQRGIASVDELTEWVCRLRTRDAHGLREALAAAGSGAWSAPEAELIDLVASSDVLPEPWANPRLVDGDGVRLLTPDLWFDDVAMAVMVHSHAYHSQGEDWSVTVERDGDLVAAGVVVVGVTPHRIRTDAASVLQRLERTYRTATARARPAVVATACPPRAEPRVG